MIGRILFILEIFLTDLLSLGGGFSTNDEEKQKAQNECTFPQGQFYFTCPLWSGIRKWQFPSQFVDDSGEFALLPKVSSSSEKFLQVATLWEEESTRKKISLPIFHKTFSNLTFLLNFPPDSILRVEKENFTWNPAGCERWNVYNLQRSQSMHPNWLVSKWSQSLAHSGQVQETRWKKILVSALKSVLDHKIVLKTLFWEVTMFWFINVVSFSLSR